MSTFDEGKVNRDGDGKFGPKSHQTVDADLDNGDYNSDPDHDQFGGPVPWNDIDADLSSAIEEAIHTHGFDHPEGVNASSVLDVLGVTQDEAEQTWGTNRARWISAVGASVAYNDPTLVRVDCSYRDPADGEEHHVDSIQIGSEGVLRGGFSVTENCPFDENDELVEGAAVPYQFTRDGKSLTAGWTNRHVTTGNIVGWQNHGIHSFEAAAWQDGLNVGPDEAARLRQEHYSPEAALVHRTYLDHRAAAIQTGAAIARAEEDWSSAYQTSRNLSFDAEMERSELAELIDSRTVSADEVDLRRRKIRNLNVTAQAAMSRAIHVAKQIAELEQDHAAAVQERDYQFDIYTSIKDR